MLLHSCNCHCIIDSKGAALLLFQLQMLLPQAQAAGNHLVQKFWVGSTSILRAKLNVIAAHGSQVLDCIDSVFNHLQAGW